MKDWIKGFLSIDERKFSTLIVAFLIGLGFGLWGFCKTNFTVFNPTLSAFLTYLAAIIGGVSGFTTFAEAKKNIEDIKSSIPEVQQPVQVVQPSQTIQTNQQPINTVSTVNSSGISPIYNGNVTVTPYVGQVNQVGPTGQIIPPPMDR